MSLNDVRRRAQQFEAAERQYDQWMQTRYERSDHPADEHEWGGYSLEVQHGSPSRRWRELESHLRTSRVWEVGELPEQDQVDWAKKVNALSETLSQPERHQIAGRPTPRVARPSE